MNLVIWDKEQKNILKTLKNSLRDVDKTLAESYASKKADDEVRRFLNTKRQVLMTNIELIKQGILLNPSSATGGSVLFFVDLSRQDADFSKTLFEDMKHIRTNYDRVNTRIQISGANYVSQLGTTGAYLGMSFDNVDDLQQLISELRDPSPQDRFKELLSFLTSQNPKNANLLISAWKVLEDKTNPERFSQACSSMRNLFYRFLGHFGPDEKVIAKEGYISGRGNGKGPSWAQRAIYAICGKNKDIEETELRQIEVLTNSTNYHIEKLSEITKLRDSQDSEMQNLTEGVLDECQIYLLNMKEARKKYFKE